MSFVTKVYLQDGSKRAFLAREINGGINAATGNLARVAVSSPKELTSLNMNQEPEDVQVDPRIKRLNHLPDEERESVLSLSREERELVLNLYDSNIRFGREDEQVLLNNLYQAIESTPTAPLLEECVYAIVRLVDSAIHENPPALNLVIASFPGVASVTIRDNPVGGLLMHHASMFGLLEIAQQLHQLNPEAVHVADALGLLPLHCACRFARNYGTISSNYPGLDICMVS